MKLHEELKELRSKQREINDGYRIYHDGSIKTMTITDSEEEGWYILARPIRGASVIFRKYFPTTPQGSKFMMTKDLREAIRIMALMLEMVVESRVNRENETSLRTERSEPQPGQTPVTF